jgi:preprotein translocase subunit SecE
MNLPEPVKQPVERSREFLQECWAELKKVHWPTRDETRAATIAVIVGVTVMALYLGLVDFVLAQVISLVVGRGQS